MDVFGLLVKEWQLEAANKILENDKGTILVVRPTGQGKSLVRDAVALALRGVTLMVVPLFTLGSDQLEKIRKKIVNKQEQNVFIYHLDEFQGTLLFTPLIDSLKSLSEKTSSMTFLFASPRILEKNKQVKKVVKLLLQTQILRSIAYDKIHLFHHFT